MRKSLASLVLAAGLCLPSAVHALCPGDNDPLIPTPNGTVCGTVTWLGYNPSTGYYYDKSTNTMIVKICPANSLSGCTTAQTYPYKDGYGKTRQGYKFSGFRPAGSPYASYDLYAYNYWSTDYWGSTTAYRTRISVNYLGLHGVSFYALPRPLPPTPVYPSGNQVPNNYLVRWKSGIDNDRKAYAVNYEVWYKYWPFGDVEPATWLLSRDNMPCQDNGGGPDINNECSTYVAGPQPAGNWKWRVVANFSPGYSTTSSEMAFVQPY
ncbi:MAG TPA: hypothetical protein VLE27_03490 [Thermoanaerobaculia bacterium]|nr:hypothetical protein [Thermoanaerobaculia bacterium]